MKIKKVFKVSSIVFLAFLIVILSAILIVFTKSINEVRKIEINLSNNITSVCKIYDKDGKLINDKINLATDYIELEDISPYLTKAFISIEDKKFYKHGGLNYLRIVKAMINNIVARDFVEGASTISQQLIKNKYLTNEKSIDRKIKEMYLTLKLEAHEDKDTIIESYINTIYYGNGAYGISNASHRFFNKKPIDLTLSECATLAGIVKSPAKYSPINNFNNSKSRRNLILKEMYKDKAITEEEYQNAIQEELVVNIQELNTFNNLDLYSKKVINEASEILNISKYEIMHKGYKIYTYQDKEHQKLLDEIVNDDRYYQKNEYGNIADNLTLIMNNENATISAVAGRSNYDLTAFKRQPGSLIKPILVYTPAYEEKLIYPCSQILDEKFTINNYSPQNVLNEYYGNISVRDAIAKSLNIPVVKLCNELGLNKCKNYAEKAGIKFNKNDMGLAIALGGLTEGLTLEEITNSYTPLSNGGLYQKYGFIKEIKTVQNLTLYTRNMTPHTYCSQDSAYLMTENLMYASKNGTSKKLKNINFEVASKTGTVNVKDSNYNTDAYSLAYTTKHTISTWLGNYTMDKKFNLNGNNNGGTFATEIIKSVLEKIYDNKTPENFEVPDTIISLPIDTISLENNNEILLGYNIPNRYQKYEIFSSDNLPTKQSNLYQEMPNINLTITNENEHLNISFNTLEYYDYYLYKNYNNKDTLLKKFTDKNDLITYQDYNIEYNQKYKYYIIIKSPYNNLEYKSNIEEIIISKNYDNMLDNIKFNNYYTWLFS